MYLDEPVEMTKVLGLYYPVVIKEAEDNVTAEFLYETEEYQNQLQGVQRLYEAGVYQPEAEEDGRKKQTFLSIDTMFMSEDAYASKMGDRNWWDNYAFREIWQEPLWQLSCNAKETGITTECQNPEEVFQFMCELYKDAELVNALMYGEKGADYELDGKRAVGKNPQEMWIPCNYAGNQFLGYAQNGEDENKKEVYTQILQETNVSKINGFSFSGENCRKELESVLQVSLGYMNHSGKDFLYENEKMIEEYKNAGIDKVTEEWNRQFQEWNSGQ